MRGIIYNTLAINSDVTCQQTSNLMQPVQSCISRKGNLLEVIWVEIKLTEKMPIRH